MLTPQKNKRESKRIERALRHEGFSIPVGEFVRTVKKHQENVKHSSLMKGKTEYFVFTNPIPFGRRVRSAIVIRGRQIN